MRRVAAAGAAGPIAVVAVVVEEAHPIVAVAGAHPTAGSAAAGTGEDIDCQSTGPDLVQDSLGVVVDSPAGVAAGLDSLGPAGDGLPKTGP